MNQLNSIWHLLLLLLLLLWFVCCVYLYKIPFVDPQEWSRDQVRAWLQYMMKQFKISITQDIENIFDEDGPQLSQLNEIDFINRIPQVI